MLDQRNGKPIQLDGAQVLKVDAAYAFTDEVTGKKLVAKLIANYDDTGDWMLVAEFKKMALLSAEPEIGTVYFLAKCEIGGEVRSCYVLDFIQGRELSDVISTSKPTFVEVENIVIQLATALEKAHAADIFHQDIHERNVIISRFGGVKLIDFLWHTSRVDQGKAQELDLCGFKEVVEKLISSSSERDQKRLTLVKRICVEAKTFHELSRKLSFVSEVATDLSYLREKSLLILGIYLPTLAEDYEITQVIFEEGLPIPAHILDSIPEKPDPPTEQDDDPFSGLADPLTFQSSLFPSSYVGAFLKPKIKPLPKLDARIYEIRSKINSDFYTTFLELERLDLARVDSWVEGNDPLYGGPPYTFSYQIAFTPKFLRWRELYHTFPFVPEESEKTVCDVVFLTK